MTFLRRLLVGMLMAGCVASGCANAAETADGRWIASWVTAPQVTEPNNLPPAPGFKDTTLRQIIHLSIGGSRLRVRLTNAFGATPLTVTAAHVARASAGHSAIQPESDRVLTWHGRKAVTISAGALVVSDPVDLEAGAMTDLAVTLQVEGVPANVTGHPGSRTTSFLQPGDAVAAVELPEAQRVDHWYFIGGVEVWAPAGAAAVVTLGDSITDGRGSTTNGNDRWPDLLSRRLRVTEATADVAVLNQGIGGNRILRDGLGPNVLARLERDVLAQPGVRWLIVFEGINDLGTAVGARAKGEPAATAEDLIAGYEQIARRAQAQGIRVYGATVMPFEGFTAYYTPESEADRQTINRWIRTSGAFDAVIDFDAVTRDPEHPTRLSAAVDGGDHLHPSAAGYRIMADAIDLALFAR